MPKTSTAMKYLQSTSRLFYNAGCSKLLPNLGQAILSGGRLKECDTCCEDRWKADFRLPTVGCTHRKTTCSGCVKHHLMSQVEYQGNMTPGGHVRDSIACPTAGCTAIFLPTDVNNAFRGDAPGLERFSKLQLEKVLSRIPGFRYCPIPDCGYGQEVLGNTTIPDTYWTCQKCKTNVCIKHNAPHFGQTCRQYDGANARTDRRLKWRTHLCPRCHQGIEKDEGCDHMTCRCGYQFCWVCQHEWHGFSNHHHETWCAYYVPEGGDTLITPVTRLLAQVYHLGIRDQLSRVMQWL